MIDENTKDYSHISVKLNDTSKHIILTITNELGYHIDEDLAEIRLDLLFRYLDELNDNYLKLAKEFDVFKGEKFNLEELGL